MPPARKHAAALGSCTRAPAPMTRLTAPKRDISSRTRCISDTHAAVNAAAAIKSREVQKWSEVTEPTTRPAVMNELVASMRVRRCRRLPPISANIGNKAPIAAITLAKGCPDATPTIGGAPHAMAKRTPRSQCNRVAWSCAAKRLLSVPSRTIILGTAALQCPQRSHPARGHARPGAAAHALRA